ncbi:MAG: hypothetical protein R3E31_20505 [Chloroflexota bacterium]
MRQRLLPTMDGITLSWLHDGTTARIYLDGRLDGEAVIVAEAADGGLNLGGNPNSAIYFWRDGRDNGL